MKKYPYLNRSLFICLFGLSIQGQVQANSSTKEILIDNDKVEMARMVYPAGSESGIHTHAYPTRTVYFIKGGKLELIPANKSQETRVLEAVAGQTLYLPATTHNVRNIGTTEIIIIETEIK